jgi:hypothetical protein
MIGLLKDPLITGKVSDDKIRQIIFGGHICPELCFQITERVWRNE